MTQPANLRARAFAGTAQAYLRFRPPYPERLLADLLARASARGQGRVLDLATGPGRIALALAPHVSHVEAVDLEPDMIAAGRAESVRRGITNVHWSVGRAEAVAAEPASFDLITIGEAFHRLDQSRVAALAFGWLRPGGALATLGCPTMLGGDAPWQQAVREVALEWTRPAFPQGWATSTAGAVGPGRDETVLRAAGFEAVESVQYPEPFTWTVESVIGYLRTASVTAPAIIGPDRRPFEAAVSAALLACDPSGVYPEMLPFGVTFGGRP